MTKNKAEFLEESERILTPDDMQNQDETIESIKEVLDKEMRIEKIKEILNKESAMRINGIIVDLFSASIYANVYNSLSDKNKQKLENMPIEKAIETCYKITK